MGNGKSIHYATIIIIFSSHKCWGHTLKYQSTCLPNIPTFLYKFMMLHGEHLHWLAFHNPDYFHNSWCAKLRIGINKLIFDYISACMIPVLLLLKFERGNCHQSTSSMSRFHCRNFSVSVCHHIIHYFSKILYPSSWPKEIYCELPYFSVGFLLYLL